jgi:putative transposase
MDNGPEFSSRALDAWAYRRGVELRFIRPGKPIENCFVESFNGKFRDECLNQHWFTDLADARRSIEAWRLDYNEVRPHSSLGGLAPKQFSEAALRSRSGTSAPLQKVALNSLDLTF